MAKKMINVKPDYLKIECGVGLKKDINDFSKTKKAVKQCDGKKLKKILQTILCNSNSNSIEWAVVYITDSDENVIAKIIAN